MHALKIAVFRLILNIYPSIISSVAILRTSLSATNANCSIDYRKFFLQLQYVELHVPGFLKCKTQEQNFLPKLFWIYTFEKH